MSIAYNIHPTFTHIHHFGMWGLVPISAARGLFSNIDKVGNRQNHFNHEGTIA